MAGRIFQTLVKSIKRLGSSLNEKPTVEVEDYTLEHFYLYHGLAGSSPENQRSFKDVRVDIQDAVNAEDSSHLGIDLKLTPLWWSDKLKKIASEFNSYHKLEKTLLPDLSNQSERGWPNDADPLGHSDWRTRSNAATLLAFIKCEAADERMVKALHDTAENTKAAFCHVAYALSSLGTALGASGLKAFLHDEQPWFRVDAVGALAKYENQKYIVEISDALLDYHSMHDYASVAATRGIKPLAFLQNSHPAVQDAGCVIVVGLLDASKQTFNEEVLDQADLHLCVDALQSLAQADPTALRLRALLKLREWAESEKSSLTSLGFDTDLVEKKIVSAIDLAATRPTMCYWNALKLAGEAHLTALAKQLLKELDKYPQFNDTIIDSLGALGDAAAAEPLVSMARKLVDLKDRTERQPSKQPIAESEPEKAKTYWSILKAFVHIDAPSAVPFLTEATSDYAPDKREQALAALVKQSAAKQSQSLKATQQIVLKGLADIAPPVRAVALQGVAELGLIQAVDVVVEMVDSREISLSRQAASTLTELAMAGHTEKVRSALTQRIQREPNQHRKQKLQDILQGI